MSKKARTQENAAQIALPVPGVNHQAGTFDRLEPLNKMQAIYMQAIMSDKVIICTGVLGSSKTYIPTMMAADLLRDKKIQKILIARPTEGKAKTTGYNKGSLNEKLAGWCTPVLATLKKRLGTGNVEAYLANGRIEMLSLEQVKGRTEDDTFIIIDEAEDLDPAVAKSLVTRHGLNTTIVIAGDIAQKDIKSFSGLDILLKVAPLCPGLRYSHIDFNSWDYCVRSDEAKAWGQGFEEFERLCKEEREG